MAARFFFDGPRLAAAIADAGLTQVTLAEKLGIAQTTIGRWIKDGRGTAVDRAKEVAKALDVPLDTIKGDARQVPGVPAGIGEMPKHDLEVTYQVAQILPQFPWMPLAPPIDGSISSETMAVIVRLRELEELTKRYLQVIRGQLRQAEEAAQEAYNDGVPVAPTVKIEVNKRTVANRLSWAKIARDLAGSDFECPSCGTESPIVEDTNAWEVELKESAGSKEVEEFVITKAEEGA